ncbi:MAG: type II toxin-antitoxin system HicB family antitoxin [Candidatus Nomurabacteria bacterium]|nr:type II toxin-antitoxin system HicB family antitoxin [Candidatus Nomurabacteria bacterium]
MKAVKTNPYISIISEDGDGNYNVIFPDFPGCVTCGKTFEEARINAKEALSLWLEETKIAKRNIFSFTKNASLVTVSA